MRLIATLFALITISGAALADAPADPLKSPMWADMVKKFLSDGDVVLDERVTVSVPPVVENQAQVPVTVDARALANVEKLIVFADLNPLQHVLTITPKRAQPFAGFRMKVEQATPVRAAAKTSDGVWHVGSAYLQAAGGGCSAPAMARSDENWSTTVGQTRGRLYREADGQVRARFRVRHPMDTGLAKDNTPAYFIEHLDVRAASGEPLAAVELFEPIGEDPTLTLLLRLEPSEVGVDIDGRDNNGGVYRSKLPAPWRQSALPSSRRVC